MIKRTAYETNLLRDWIPKWQRSEDDCIINPIVPLAQGQSLHDQIISQSGVKSDSTEHCFDALYKVLWEDEAENESHEQDNWHKHSQA